MQGFEPLPRARFSIEADEGTEWVVSRVRRNWFVIPFLALWLTLWTGGGFAAIGALISGEIGDRLFIGLWLVGWAAGWIFAASWLAWQFGGRTQIGMRGGALEYRWRMLLLSRTRRYDGMKFGGCARDGRPGPGTPAGSCSPTTRPSSR